MLFLLIALVACHLPLRGFFPSSLYLNMSPQFSVVFSFRFQLSVGALAPVIIIPAAAAAVRVSNHFFSRIVLMY
jgi:hypothetical protein